MSRPICERTNCFNEATFKDIYEDDFLCSTHCKTTLELEDMLHYHQDGDGYFEYHEKRLKETTTGVVGQKKRRTYTDKEAMQIAIGFTLGYNEAIKELRQKLGIEEDKSNED